MEFISWLFFTQAGSIDTENAPEHTCLWNTPLSHVIYLVGLSYTPQHIHVKLLQSCFSYFVPDSLNTMNQINSVRTSQA